MNKTLKVIACGLLIAFGSVALNNGSDLGGKQLAKASAKPTATVKIKLLSRRPIRRYALGGHNVQYVEAVQLKSGKVITWSSRGKNSNYPLVGNLLASANGKPISQDIIDKFDFASWDNIVSGPVGNNVRCKTSDEDLANNWYLEKYELSPTYAKGNDLFFKQRIGYRIVHYVPMHEYHWIDAK